MDKWQNNEQLTKEKIQMAPNPMKRYLILEIMWKT